MNEKLSSSKRYSMRRSGKRIVALSVLLIVCLLLSAWLHPPAAALDEWEFDRIPWNVWVVMTKFISSPVHHLFLTTPLLIGVWQFLSKPNPVNTILRCLAYIWLFLLWFLFISLTFMIDIFPNL